MQINACSVEGVSGDNVGSLSCDSDNFARNKIILSANGAYTLLVRSNSATLTSTIKMPLTLFDAIRGFENFFSLLYRNL